MRNRTEAVTNNLPDSEEEEEVGDSEEDWQPEEDEKPKKRKAAARGSAKKASKNGARGGGGATKKRKKDESEEEEEESEPEEEESDEASNDFLYESCEIPREKAERESFTHFLLNFIRSPAILNTVCVLKKVCLCMCMDAYCACKFSRSFYDSFSSCLYEHNLQNAYK